MFQGLTRIGWGKTGASPSFAYHVPLLFFNASDIRQLLLKTSYNGQPLATLFGLRDTPVVPGDHRVTLSAFVEFIMVLTGGVPRAVNLSLKTLVEFEGQRAEKPVSRAIADGSLLDRKSAVFMKVWDAAKQPLCQFLSQRSLLLAEDIIQEAFLAASVEHPLPLDDMKLFESSSGKQGRIEKALILLELGLFVEADVKNNTYRVIFPRSVAQELQKRGLRRLDERYLQVLTEKDKGSRLEYIAMLEIQRRCINMELGSQPLSFGDVPELKDLRLPVASQRVFPLVEKRIKVVTAETKVGMSAFGDRFSVSNWRTVGFGGLRTESQHARSFRRVQNVRSAILYGTCSEADG